MAGWREIADGFARHGIPVRHVALHADQDTLRRRIEDDAVVGWSTFRTSRLAPYAEAADGWLHEAAEVVSTVGRTPEQVARGIADGQPAAVRASPTATG